MFESIALSLVAALNRLDAMTVMGIFAVLVLALFGLALVLIGQGRAAAFYRSAPALLTTLGILGTFLGIAIGLLQFDVSRIEYSIPTLLDGLKLAFVTSIVGILLSICLRLVLTTVPEAERRPEPDRPRAQAADHGPRQVQLAEAQLQLTQRLSEQLASFDTQLAASLARQHQTLLNALGQFAEQLSDTGSRQLIGALEKVIRDFNDKLGEQFGANFRKLDSSVGKLLEWQQTYREHLETLGQQLDHAIGGVAQSETALRALTGQAERISRHVSDQEAAMASLRRETVALEALLSSIADLRDKAKDAFPAMDSRLTAMLENIEQAVLATQGYGQRLERFDPPPGSHPYQPTHAGLAIGHRQ